MSFTQPLLFTLRRTYKLSIWQVITSNFPKCAIPWPVLKHSTLRLISTRFKIPSIKTAQDSPTSFKDSKNLLHEILANRAWKGRASQHGQFWPIYQRAGSALLASIALSCPICQDFMQYFFGILEAYWLTQQCRFCLWYLKLY